MIQDFVDGLDLSNRNKLSFDFHETIARQSFRKLNESERAEVLKRADVTEGEVSTFQALHDYCTSEKKKQRKSWVYYLHTKGGCCTRKTEPVGRRFVSSWREAMNAFLYEFPSICLRALHSGYQASYSGNFWWATCDHVASLPRLWNPFDACEFVCRRCATEYFLLFGVLESILF
jgi:hypothetical protein